MNTLDAKMKELLATQLPIIATVTDGNTPNLGPKRTLRLYDDNTLIFNENTGGQTLANMQNGSKVAVAVINWQALEGYRFLGRAEIFAEGAAYDNAVAYAESKGMKPPKFGVLVHIEEIFSLAPGPTTAGKKL